MLPWLVLAKVFFLSEILTYYKSEEMFSCLRAGSQGTHQSESLKIVVKFTICLSAVDFHQLWVVIFLHLKTSAILRLDIFYGVPLISKKE